MVDESEVVMMWHFHFFFRQRRTLMSFLILNWPSLTVARGWRVSQGLTGPQ